jgi:hypothetical protein
MGMVPVDARQGRGEPNGVRSPARRPVSGSGTTALTRRTSLELPLGLSISDWRYLGERIFVISDSSAWWLGDWLVYGQNLYPDRYERVINETGLDYKTLRNYAWVARKVPASGRRDKLSFQHHAEVAGLSEDQQHKWLAMAEENGWTRGELRRRIRDSRSQGGENSLPRAVVELEVFQERQERWQMAAASSDMEFLEWIIVTLDRVAGHA